MPVFERRLQILLDEERCAVVESETARPGRSVAAVIREAIDVRFSSDVAVRAAAATRDVELHASVELTQELVFHRTRRTSRQDAVA